MAVIHRSYGQTAEKLINGDFLTCIKLYEKAIIKENDDRLFLRWCTGYQKTMSYQEFNDALVKPPQKEETEEEILEKVKKILGGKYGRNI